MSKSYRCGLERTGADIGTAPAGGDAIFAPASEEKSAMQGWNTLVVRPSIGEDGELAEPEAPAGARPPLPALPARAELRDAEVHAMLGELDFGESTVMGDATAEEVCKALSITKRALQYYRSAGIIPYTALGNKVLFRDDDIRHLLEKNLIKSL